LPPTTPCRFDWQPTNPAWLMGALYCYNAGMAALGLPDDAIQHLQQAVERGFANADQMATGNDLNTTV